MNCLPSIRRALKRARVYPVLLTVWYTLWSTGGVIAALDILRSKESTAAPVAAAVEESHACDGESSCCCGPTAHDANSCCCPAPSPTSSPIPGLPTWSAAPCHGTPDDSSIPATERLAPHFAEFALAFDSALSGKIVSLTFAGPVEAPTRAIDKVPLPIAG